MPSNWKRRQGKAFEDEVSLSLKALGEKWDNFWYMRLMDYKEYYKINPNLVAQRQPSDFLAVCNGKVYFLECKSSHSRRRYGLKYVKDHQKKSLVEVEKAGAFGYVLLSWRRWSYKPRKRNRLFAFRIDDWLRMEQDVLGGGYKSVNWGTIISRGVEVWREKVWMLEKIFLIE